MTSSKSNYSTIRTAIATCSNLPTWEMDDHPFYQALCDQNFDISLEIWDDPNVCWSNYDLCLIRTTWDYSVKYENFIAWIEFVSTQTTLINPKELLIWNISKTYLFELEKKGIPIAPSLIIEPKDDILAKFGSSSFSDSPKFFCKPLIGASSIFTLRFERHETSLLMEHFYNVSRPMILQPYISTVEEQGEYSLIYFGAMFSHAVQKIPVKGDYKVQDDYGANDKPFLNIPQKLFDISESILNHLPKNSSYIRIDFLNMQGLYGRDWVVNEVECIEPSLFFRHSQDAPQNFAQLLRKGFDI